MAYTTSTDVQTNPIVSIIVITYNSAKYVLETLESINAQTYHNIELIISDDASVDNTVDVCRQWILKNNKRFVHTELITVNQNTGVSANCNRGVQAVHGEWVKIIGGDDAFYQNAIESLVRFISMNDGAEAIMTKTEIFNETFEPENSIVIQPNNGELLKIYSAASTASDQLEYILNGGFHYTAGLFVKNIYDEIGLYDEKYTLIEDIPFFLNMGLHGKIIRFAPIVTVKYRKHKSNLTSDKSKIVPSYFQQTYLAAYRASKKYGKFKYIVNNYWHTIMIAAIFSVGNQGVLGSILNRARILLQPIRFFNLMKKVSKF